MYLLHDINWNEVRWVKPKWWKPFFELRDGTTVVATLAWTRGSRALGQWDEVQYHFSQEGRFRRRIVVSGATVDAAAAPIATFTPDGGGTLTFPDGRAFRWKKPKRWTNEHSWVDAAATELIRFHPATWRSFVAVTRQSGAVSLPELPLLILLGQYLIVLAAQAAATASIAAMVPTMANS